MHGGLTKTILNVVDPVELLVVLVPEVECVVFEVMHPLVSVSTIWVATLCLYEWPCRSVANAPVTSVVVGVEDLIVISLSVLWSNVLTFSVLALVNRLNMWVLLSIRYELRRENTVLPAWLAAGWALAPGAANVMFPNCFETIRTILPRLFW